MHRLFKTELDESVALKIDVFDGEDVATVTWPDKEESEHSADDMREYIRVFQSALNALNENRG
jgi:hypothetical protein